MLPREPQTISKILDAGFALYGKTLRSVFLFSLVPPLIGALPSVLQYLLNVDVGKAMGEAAIKQDFSRFIPWIGVIAATYFVMVMLLIVAQAGVLYKQGMAGRDAPQSNTQTLQHLLQRALPLIGVAFCYFFIVVIMIAACVAPSVPLIATKTFGGAASGVLLIFLLMLIPIYFSLALSFSSTSVVLQNRGPIDGLTTSFAIVKNNWWRTAVVLTIPYLLYMIVTAVVAGIGGIIFGIAFFKQLADPSQLENFQRSTLLFSAVLSLVMVPLNAVVFPLITACKIAMFNDLVLRREGGDLQAQIERL
jgi:hypothetical protein